LARDDGGSPRARDPAVAHKCIVVVCETARDRRRLEACEQAWSRRYEVEFARPSDYPGVIRATARECRITPFGVAHAAETIWVWSEWLLCPGYPKQTPILRSRS